MSVGSDGCQPQKPLARRDNIADDHDGRRPDLRVADLDGDASERRDDDAFLGERRRSDHGGRRVGRQAAAHQRVRDFAQAMHRHVDDDRLPGARERAPVEVLVLAVAGCENHRAIDAAERGGDRRPRQRREPRGHARDHAERHARCGERRRFLAAAPEYERIAALEPQHAFARAREFDQPLADIRLHRRGSAAALAGEFEPRLFAGKRQHPAIDQRVMHHDVGLGEPGEGIEREQARVAGAGAGEPDMAGRENGNTGPPSGNGGVGGHRRTLLP